MIRYDKVKLAFDFFCIKEKSGQSFTLRELADFTGWKIETCKTYASKRWHHLLNQSSGGEYRSIEMSSLTSDEFLSLHSQKLATHQNNSEQTELVNKAKDFAMLAVGIYNNPLFKLKTYGYIVNITIAFTALFQSIFLKKVSMFLKKTKMVIILRLMVKKNTLALKHVVIYIGENIQHLSEKI